MSDDIEARRAKRKAEAAAAAKVQRDKDLEEIDALEVQYGDSNVSTIEVGHTPGLPVLLAVRTPQDFEIKRYRDTVKTRKDGSPGDTVLASEQLAAVCVIYPDAETYKKVLAARPGVDANLALECVKLSTGKTEAEGKG